MLTVPRKECREAKAGSHHLCLLGIYVSVGNMRNYILNMGGGLQKKSVLKYRLVSISIKFVQVNILKINIYKKPNFIQKFIGLISAMALIIIYRKFLQKVFWPADLFSMNLQMLKISIQLCLLVVCKHTKYYVWIIQYLMYHASSSPSVFSFSSSLASFT